MIKSHPVLFFTKHRHVIQILRSYTRAVGRFSDVVWYDLSVTFRMGWLLLVIKMHLVHFNSTVRMARGRVVQRTHFKPPGTEERGVQFPVRAFSGKGRMNAP